MLDSDMLIVLNVLSQYPETISYLDESVYDELISKELFCLETFRLTMKGVQTMTLLTGTKIAC